MEQSKSTYSCILVRHAESQYNREQLLKGGLNATIQASAESLNVKFDQSLIDCSITSDEGIKQCEAIKQQLYNKNITIVYVSPLKRALETCYQIFKDWQHKPKIIAHPLFREMILSSCDIGAGILESQDKYKDFFDFSFIQKYENPKLWVVYELVDEKIKEDILKKIKNECKTNEEFLQNGHIILLKIIKEMYPQHIEDESNNFFRTNLQKNLISKEARNLQKGQKIAIIGHSRTLQNFTASSFSNEMKPLDGKWLNNGEALELELPFSDQN